MINILIFNFIKFMFLKQIIFYTYIINIKLGSIDKKAVILTEEERELIDSICSNFSY